MFQAQNIVKNFGQVRAVDDVSFAVEKPEMIGIIGRSGAGKSTLLRVINRLTDATSGASPISQNRFGVIPQITPVLLSQILYYLESNTRSATIIGAIVGGGIGLLLTQAIITQKDWEEVTYFIILIVVMVFIMDSLSGWLRRRLIKGDA